MFINKYNKKKIKKYFIYLFINHNLYKYIIIINLIIIIL